MHSFNTRIWWWFHMTENSIKVTIHLTTRTKKQNPFICLHLHLHSDTLRPKWTPKPIHLYYVNSKCHCPFCSNLRQMGGACRYRLHEKALQFDCRRPENPRTNFEVSCNNSPNNAEHTACTALSPCMYVLTRQTLSTSCREKNWCNL